MHGVALEAAELDEAGLAEFRETLDCAIANGTAHHRPAPMTEIQEFLEAKADATPGVRPETRRVLYANTTWQLSFRVC